MLTPEQLWENEKDFCEKYTGDCIRERDFIRIITKRDKLSSQLKPLVMQKIMDKADEYIKHYQKREDEEEKLGNRELVVFYNGMKSGVRQLMLELLENNFSA